MSNEIPLHGVADIIIGLSAHLHVLLHSETTGPYVIYQDLQIPYPLPDLNLLPLNPSGASDVSDVSPFLL